VRNLLKLKPGNCKKERAIGVKKILSSYLNKLGSASTAWEGASPYSSYALALTA
jgi:hypothetical protein